MNIFRFLSILSTLITVVLITFGAFVRLEGAGLSCPDWPLCYGQLIPPPGYRIALEVGHRFLASILGVILIVMVAMTYGVPALKRCKRLTGFTLFTIVVQGILGGATVIYALHPVSVVLHLIFGNLTLLLLVYLTLMGTNNPKNKPRIPCRLKRTVWMAILFFVILVSGGANSASYSGYSCPAFPLCLPDDPMSFFVSIETAEINTGEIIPKNAAGILETYGQSAWIHMIHRLIAILGSMALIAYAVGLYKATRHTPQFSAWSGALIGLLTAEIGIGILNAVYRVPVPISALHTLIASLIVGIFGVLLFYSSDS